MTSRERILAAVAGNKTDLMPVAPYSGNFAAVLTGTPLGEYYTNPVSMAEAQLKAWGMTGSDVIVPQSDNYYIAEGFGCSTEIQENDLPIMRRRVLSCLEEVETLKVPIPEKDGRMPVFLEAVALIKQKMGEQVAIRSGGTGPFSLAGHLFGTENLMIAIALAEVDEDVKQQQRIMMLMEKTSDALIAFQKSILMAGGDFAVCGDSSASPDLISPAIYEKYIFPFEQKVFTAINPVCRRNNAVSLLHICGNTTPILHLMKETGADILEIDHKVNLKEAREIAGETQCLMGNVDPLSVLLQGTVEDVHRTSVECYNLAGLNGFFILGTGCEVAPHTPLVNYMEMIKTARGIHIP